MVLLRYMECIILAAGLSSRMSNQVKLLLPYEGKPLIIHAVRAALDAVDRVVVVTGFHAEAVAGALRTLLSQHLSIVHNEQFHLGQFASTQVGVREISPDTDFFITMADLPLIRSDHYRLLIPMLETHDAIRPYVGPTPGHPVLHHRRLREEILRLPSSSSMNTFLNQKDVIRYDADDPAWITDIDTKEDYLHIIGSQPSSGS